MAFRRTSTLLPVAPVDASSEYGSNIDHDLVLPDAPAADSLTDYGSELDTDGEEILSQLADGLGGNSGEVLVLESIVEEDNNNARGVAHLPKYSSQDAAARSQTHNKDTRVEIEVNDESDTRNAHSKPRQSSFNINHEVSTDELNPSEAPDTRSPIERFRQAPKKALSVTDIISPAWCELQYFYTLSKYGRKKATPAMKQGTKVHKKLEAEVHEVVPVDVQTKEDRWGLRMWNVIQGLRTLRATGLTRELEIWGVIDGQVVNGVIDEVSHTCPDPELETALEKSTTPANQRKITDMFSSQAASGTAWLSSPHPVHKVYLTDVKTRAAKSLPQGSSLRPMQMQLMLYHRLLGELASNTVPADHLFDRYGLDSKTPFSDAFVAAIAKLDGSFILEPEREARPTRLATSELAAHNSLNQLWSLMITEFQRTIPTPDAVGSVLQAEFRRQKDGSVLGNTTFAYDDAVHRAFVDDEMKWWKGERAAKGVEIEEAFKCGICEFAEGCEWRIQKLEESVAKFRERRRMSGKV